MLERGTVNRAGGRSANHLRVARIDQAMLAVRIQLPAMDQIDAPVEAVMSRLRLATVCRRLCDVRVACERSQEDVAHMGLQMVA